MSVNIDMSAITATERKTVKSLAETKHRDELGLFVAEGTKCVLDTIDAFETHVVYARKEWLDDESHLSKLNGAHVKVMGRADAERMSAFSTPPPVLAVYRIPKYDYDVDEISKNLVLALDRIQDPGNLGTLIRLCDWFGINDILASEDTVSAWNPKVVQATMGAIARVRVHEVDLPAALESWPPSSPVAGTFLGGSDIYNTPLPPSAVIVMGNEGRGISDRVAAACDMRLTIPSYPPRRQTSESLNVAMAASVAISEWRRRLINKV